MNKKDKKGKNEPEQKEKELSIEEMEQFLQIFVSNYTVDGVYDAYINFQAMMLKIIKYPNLFTKQRMNLISQLINIIQIPSFQIFQSLCSQFWFQQFCTPEKEREKIFDKKNQLFPPKMEQKDRSEVLKFVKNIIQFILEKHSELANQDLDSLKDFNTVNLILFQHYCDDFLQMPPAILQKIEAEQQKYKNGQFEKFYFEYLQRNHFINKNYIENNSNYVLAFRQLEAFEEEFSGFKLCQGMNDIEQQYLFIIWGELNKLKCDLQKHTEVEKLAIEDDLQKSQLLQKSLVQRKLHLSQKLSKIKDNSSKNEKSILSSDNQVIQEDQGFNSEKVEQIEIQDGDIQFDQEEDDDKACCRSFFVLNEKLPVYEDFNIEFKNYNFPFRYHPDKLDPVHILRKTICGFLNNQGGVIMLGVTDLENQVKGVFLSHKQQDDFKIFVNNFLASKDFDPPIRKQDREVQVFFVPIKNDKGQWIRGLWVPKIVVQQGSERDQLYTFVPNGDQEKLKAFIRLDGEVEELNPLKQKRETRKLALNPRKEVGFHECVKPDTKGVKECKLLFDFEKQSQYQKK